MTDQDTLTLVLGRANKLLMLRDEHLLTLVYCTETTYIFDLVPAEAASALSWKREQLLPFVLTQHTSVTDA